mmetsp:Transcript_44525/g.71321  ORF Transcript_44525/g.71321 Transcript_44525/m.71321 type:complete len:176 (-) Transcript_44525:885-1412(-)
MDLVRTSEERSDSEDSEDSFVAAFSGMSSDFFQDTARAEEKRKQALAKRESLLKRTWAISPLLERVKYMVNTPSEGLKVVNLQQTQGLQQMIVWDCAVVLSRYIENNPELIAGKCVIELGCGIGLPGIVCGTLGASRVALTERPLAIESIRKQVSLTVQENIYEFLADISPNRYL